MDIFIYQKNKQQRLDEYVNILSGRGDVVPASQIHSEWSYHIELVIEPLGWQALWKIPRLTCQEFGIHYPTIVVVEVEHTDFTDHSARARIIAVQDDIHLLEKYDVPLIELYPTKKQENSAIDVVRTAECIEQLRFFYNYLWMPWDADDDDTMDWVTGHLEPRLNLFYDMKEGIVCKKTCDVIRSLTREGKDIQAKIAKLELEISDDENEEEECRVDEIRTCQLMKLHLRLHQIKNEVSVLENPTMRDILVKNQNLIGNEKEYKRRESRGRQIEAHFVWLGGHLEETIETLNLSKSFLPGNIFIKTTNCLQEALNTSATGDIIVIGKGEHQIKSIGNLEEAGTLKGIGLPESIILRPQETEVGPTLIDFSGTELSLENITFDLKEMQTGIVARSGIVRLVNCRMIVSRHSTTKLGIIVLPGAKLVANNCSFFNLGTCIDVHASGEVNLNSCQFQKCTEGIQLNKSSKLKASDCQFTEIFAYAIRAETDKQSIKFSQIGGVELLQNLTDVEAEFCKFSCDKGSVFLHVKSKIDKLLSMKEEEEEDVAMAS